MNIAQPALRGDSFIKTTTLLAIGFFLMSAPTPDARVMAELTSNLLVNLPNHPMTLQAP